MKGTTNCENCKKLFSWTRYSTGYGAGKPARFCSRRCLVKCKNRWINNTRFLWKTATEQQKKDRLARYFNKHVIRSNGCWSWRGKFGSGGYAYMKYGENHKSIGAHRISWFLHNGFFPDKMVLHTCDNPPCTNPSHLYIGSALQNAKDRESRNRRPKKLGINHPNAKLNDEKVVEIKKLINLGVPVSKIACRFQVGKGTVEAIKRGVTWKHIN